MKPRTQKASGLIGRCFLAGALAVAGLVQGCQPLSNVQEQNLYSLTRLGIHHQEQKAMNEAIREAGTHGQRNNRIANRINPNGLKTTELWNLDTIKKEIEIVGWDEMIPYLESRKNNFPKSGFLVYNEIDNEVIGDNYIVKLIDNEFKIFK